MSRALRARAVGRHRDRLSVEQVRFPAGAPRSRSSRPSSRQGIKTKTLRPARVPPPLLDPMLEAFGAEASKVAFAAPRIPLIQPDGRAGHRRDIGCPVLTRHARQPVRFQQDRDASRRATGVHRDRPTPTLLASRAAFADAPDVRWPPPLRKRRDDWKKCSRASAARRRRRDIDWQVCPWLLARQGSPSPAIRSSASAGGRGRRLASCREDRTP